MSVDYRFEKEVYMHGACQYFAIQVAEMFNGKVCLWLDRDYTLEEGKDTVLCHAYAKIADGFYVDAYGPFSDISQRENEFEFNEQEIVECTVEEAKKILSSIKVPFTNREGKRNAREFLRNNMMIFDIFYNNISYTFGICGRYAERGKFDYLLLNSYNIANNTFGQFIHKIPTDVFVQGIKKSYGFKENKGWFYKK